jgi:type IV pilus assembly protein PilV
MMALAVLAIGTSGVVAMQKVTAVANREARNLVVANQIARGWIDKLRADSVVWNHPSPSSPGSSDLSETTWLQQVGTGWIRPNDPTNGMGYAAADALGNDISSADLADAAFCTNVRLTWLYGDGITMPGPFVMRAEVRVFWLREGAGGSVESNNAFCGTNQNTAAISNAQDRYHFVYVTSAIAQNTQ